MESTPNTLSSRGRWKLARWTICGTLGCLAISLPFNYLAFRGLGPEAMRQGLISATILPIVLAGPLFYYLTLKLRELKIVNHKLEIVAATDGLTACLNRGAFADRAEASLEIPLGRAKKPGGALLVIDADHFKSINDNYGHVEGDQALRMIAASIRGSVRSTDLVGRLGGEEFGVYLPGATVENAADIAERIRIAVTAVPFRPRGKPHALSVSVGGAVFDSPIGFSELFRIADRRLYDAKESGRNRVELSAVRVPEPPPPKAQPKKAAARY